MEDRMQGSTLEAFLASHVTATGRLDVADVIKALSGAALKISKEIELGPLGHAFADARGTINTDGDGQRQLDVHADEVFLEAIRHTPVALFASEEQDAPIVLDRTASLALAIDPLDGSSNIDANVSIGTIFSLLPAAPGAAETPAAPFFQPGRKQIAAGFFIYGPQLALVLTLGSGTHGFIYSPRMGTFIQTQESISLGRDTGEFSINASNYRHWEEAVRLYIDDCLKGEDGSRRADFNMRWIASLVAETYRILMRGGVFLYPRDAREGYGNGRLRLVYEANPIALLVEQAGGSATDSVDRILDIVPADLHQRVPLVFGCAGEVELISRYHTGPSCIGERAPLFGTRGLFRA
jgi:fructose-1,6-bisphosphatase I